MPMTHGEQSHRNKGQEMVRLWRVFHVNRQETDHRYYGAPGHLCITAAQFSLIFFHCEVILGTSNSSFLLTLSWASDISPHLENKLRYPVPSYSLYHIALRSEKQSTLDERDTLFPP